MALESKMNSAQIVDRDALSKALSNGPVGAQRLLKIFNRLARILAFFVIAAKVVQGDPLLPGVASRLRQPELFVQLFQIGFRFLQRRSSLNIGLGQDFPQYVSNGVPASGEP